MKYLCTLAIATMVWATGPAQAEQVDMSTITCKKFFEYSKENVALMLMWLDGYYKDEDADPIVDFDKLGDMAKKLGDYCGKNPNHSIITAAERTIAK